MLCCTLHLLLAQSECTNLHAIGWPSDNKRMVDCKRWLTVEDKVAAYLHPAALQWASGGHEGVGTEEANLRYPAIGARMEANPVLLEQAEWWL